MVKILTQHWEGTSKINWRQDRRSQVQPDTPLNHNSKKLGWFNYCLISSKRKLNSRWATYCSQDTQRKCQWDLWPNTRRGNTSLLHPLAKGMNTGSWGNYWEYMCFLRWTKSWAGKPLASSTTSLFTKVLSWDRLIKDHPFFQSSRLYLKSETGREKLGKRSKRHCQSLRFADGWFIFPKYFV